MRQFIFLSVFFCFASLSAVEFDFDGGAAVLPSQSFESGGNDIFGAQSSGGGTGKSTSGGYSSGGGSSSSFNNNGGGGAVGGGLLGGLSGIFKNSSSNNSTISRAFTPGVAGDTEDTFPTGALKDDLTAYNDSPVGDGAGILLTFALVYAAVAYRRKRKAVQA